MPINILARQVGNDVIFSGSGSINTIELFPQNNPFTFNGQINPSGGAFQFGNNSSVTDYFIMGSYVEITSFGTSSTTNADVNSGDGFRMSGGLIYLPSGYTSSSPLSLYMAFTGQTISSLQLSAGTYTASWGTSPNEELITLEIEPEPSPTPTPTVTPTSTPTLTPTLTSTPTSSPTRTPTPTNTATSTLTPTNSPTSTLTPTNSPTRTATPTPTNTPTLTSTPTNTPTLTLTPTNSPTRTSTPTLTATNTPTLTSTSTSTPTPTPFGVIQVDVQYEYTNQILGSYSGGTWDSSLGDAPHPISVNQEKRVAVVDLSAITLGGFGGLNN